MKGPDPLRSVVESALPQRRLAVKRDDLVEQLCERIRTWKELNQRFTSNTRRGEQLRQIAKELMPALQVAAAKLRKLGAHRSREGALMSPGLSAEQFARLAEEVGSFTTDDWLLNLAVANAMKAVEGFAVARPGRPADFGAALAAELESILREAGCSKFQRQYFFAHLNDSGELPRLSVETSRKRAQRTAWDSVERDFFRSRRPRRKAAERGISSRRGTN